MSKGMSEEEKEEFRLNIDKIRMPHPDIDEELYVKVKENSDVDFIKKSNPYRVMFLNEMLIITHLDVEYVGVPGIRKDLLVPQSLRENIVMELSKKNLNEKDLPGLILCIKSEYVTDSPLNRRSRKCPKCCGKGCEFCNDSGMSPPIRYYVKRIYGEDSHPIR